MTNIKSVVKEIDEYRRYWCGGLYGKINNERVYNQVRDYLYMHRILFIKHKISQEIKR